MHCESSPRFIGPYHTSIMSILMRREMEICNCSMQAGKKIYKKMRIVSTENRIKK